MKTLYIDCGMGAAGDMLSAALLELIPEPEKFVEKLNGLGIPGVEYKAEKAVKCGITGTHMTVMVNGEEEGNEHHHHHHDHEHVHEHEHYHEHEHCHEHSHEHECADHHHEHEHHHDHEHGHHHHSGLHDIEHIVRGHLSISKKVQDDVMAVFNLIAEAESYAHGMPVPEIHFHEVGTMDAIADITAVCMMMDELAVDEVVVSPIHVGSGQIKCAHGILPVPAPATAYILKGVPIYGGAIQGELCTPTGAAILKHFATRFGDMPVMKTQAIGYGMGKRDFGTANCVRMMLGEAEKSGDEVYELSCNIDDMTGEAIGFAMDRLFEAGALDVYTTPIGMKKSRPGVLIKAMCHEDKKEAVIQAIFKHTTTIGIRECKMNRYVLDRRIDSVETPYGTMTCKVSSGYGVSRKKYEYEDLARIAKEEGISIEEVLEKL